MRAKRALWIAKFDMENVIGSILQYGLILSMGLVLLALPWNVGGVLQAKSIPELFKQDLKMLHVPGTGRTILVHLSFAVLLLTQYIRTVASMIYFAVIECSWRHTLLIGFVVVLLTVTLFTVLV